MNQHFALKTTQICY